MTSRFRFSFFTTLLAIVSLVHLIPTLGFGADPLPKWLLQNGETYYGDPIKYSFSSKELVLQKSDGKTFKFNAGKLAHQSKMQLLGNPAFYSAPDYRLPFLPTLVGVLGIIAAISVPTVIGLWGSAHVLGAVSTAPRHLMGFGKLLAVLFLQFGVWFTLAWVLDPNMPVVPDKNADLVLLVGVTVMGLLIASLVVSFHYDRSFWKGMAITLLAGVFGIIVGTALTLGGMFVGISYGAETLLTKLVFEPFGLF